MQCRTHLHTTMCRESAILSFRAEAQAHASTASIAKAKVLTQKATMGVLFALIAVMVVRTYDKHTDLQRRLQLLPRDFSVCNNSLFFAITAYF